MAWYRCGQSGGGGSSSTPAPTQLFGDGQWKNTDLVNLVLSPSTKDYWTIQNGCLLFDSNGGGFSITEKDNKPLAIEVEFKMTGSSGVQCGNCNIGADGFLCMTTGADRHSYHHHNLSDNGRINIIGQINWNSTRAIFFAGANMEISHIYMWINGNAGMNGSFYVDS